MKYILTAVWMSIFFVSMVAASEMDRLREAGITGGVVVHLNGADTSDLAVQLGKAESYIVQELAADMKQVAEARKRIQKGGVYGRVSAEHLEGDRLPYLDESVNAVILSGEYPVAEEELMRVLVPGGLLIRNGKTERKPWDEKLDDWSHYLRDAGGNAVGQDRAFGPSRHAQWMNGPRYTRFHDKMSGLSAMVSAGGRVFYIMDEAPAALIGLDPEWRLTARDAFNGVTLWQRDIEKWQDWMTPFKMGPATLPRRLVAVGDRVYVTLGIGEPVSVLSAGTGETLSAFEGSECTEEFIIQGNVLLCTGRPGKPVVGVNFKNWKLEPWFIKAFDVETGKPLWAIESVMYPLSMAADADRLYYSDGEAMKALELKTGEMQWTSEPVTTWKLEALSWHGATTVIKDGVVLFSGGTDQKGGGKANANNPFYAFSAETGEKLWEAENPRSGHATPKDMLVMNGVAYVGDTAGPSGKGYFGYALRTGERVHEYSTPANTVLFAHQRCYRARATDKYILSSRTGTELVDTETGEWVFQDWNRGACLFGIMPSYEMLYITPQPCGCYLDHKLSGFAALRHENGRVREALSNPAPSRLTKGASYPESPDTCHSTLATISSWPTYRHDNTRGGATDARVSDTPKSAWKTQLDGRLSALTMAGGRVFVAEIDRHRVVALNADDGKTLWRFTAGGRVDSPPTIVSMNQGTPGMGASDVGNAVPPMMAVFGCRDGYIYALDAATGEMAWTFRAAPADLRMGAYGQLESVWPLHGSVLVREDTLYAIAGRSMYLDGGLRLIMLDPATGELKNERVYNPGGLPIDRAVKISMPLTKTSALPDILSDDGARLWMRAFAMGYDGTPDLQAPVLTGPQLKDFVELYDFQRKRPHLFSPTGFLDDAWFHRSYWTYASLFPGGAFGWPLSGQSAPSGRIMAVDETHAYGFGRGHDYYAWTASIEYRLYRAPKEWQTEIKNPKYTGAGKNTNSRFLCDWEVKLPFHVRAMVKTADRLIVAGPPDPVDEGAPRGGPSSPRPIPAQQAVEAKAAWEGEQGAMLWVIDPETGEKTGECHLDAIPVFDGMAAVNGKLYLSMQDGNVRCLSGGE